MRKGHERLSDVVAVCPKCHKAIHAYHKRNPKLTLWTVTDRYIRAKRLAIQTPE